MKICPQCQDTHNDIYVMCYCLTTLLFHPQRPNYITKEQTKEWIKTVPDWCRDIPRGREIYYAGKWMEEKMRDLGASDERIEDICCIMGMKMFFTTDIWPIAERTYKWLVDNPYEVW